MWVEFFEGHFWALWWLVFSIAVVGRIKVTKK